MTFINFGQPIFRLSRRFYSTALNFGEKINLASVTNGFVGAVGNTPLIRLKKLSEETGCEILGKAEFMNPGGSVKDRAALWLIKDAEEKGKGLIFLNHFEEVTNSMCRTSQTWRNCSRGYRWKHRYRTRPRLSKQRV
jgi:hypothetical protein